MRTTLKLGIALTLLLAPLALFAADWPQWNGPKRDAHSPEVGLLKTWPKDGPKLAWIYDQAGTGFTAPAVVGGKVYTMGCRKDDEFVICLDDRGKEVWATKIGPVFDFKGNQWSRGPNGTPSVDGELIYAVGSQGILVCLETAGGKEKWRVDMPKAMKAEVNNIFGGDDTVGFGWGYSWSPLVDGDRLIITPGGPKGLVAALDKKTGTQIWRSEKIPDEATYSSVIVADVEGVRQYIVMVQTGAVGVSAKDGSELWRFKRTNQQMQPQPFSDVVCPTPVYHDGHVFLTATNGPANLVALKKTGATFSAKDVYTPAAGRQLINDNGGVILVGEHLYGANGKTGWKCIEFKTGKKAWDTRDLPVGPGVYADGRLYCVSQEDGKVILAAISPKEFAEEDIKGQFELPKKSDQRKKSGKVWTHPVIADGKLYLRDQELIFCYQIK